MSLAAAHAHLTRVRACNPRLVAIRQAACDLLLDGGARTKTVVAVRRTGCARHVQVWCELARAHPHLHGLQG